MSSPNFVKTLLKRNRLRLELFKRSKKQPETANLVANQTPADLAKTFK